MKKIILVFGIIAGLIPTLWFLVYNSFGQKMNFENGMVYGYASMILAFSMIFVAVKNFRDKHNGGFISFGKAFRIGLFITLIASTIYVVAWLINYFYFNPDFMDQYTSHMIDKLKAENVAQVEIDKKLAEMNEFNKMYQNPFFNALITYTEILPVGLIISLLCACILKRMPKVSLAS